MLTLTYSTYPSSTGNDVNGGLRIYEHAGVANVTNSSSSIYRELTLVSMNLKMTVSQINKIKYAHLRFTPALRVIVFATRETI